MTCGGQVLLISVVTPVGGEQRRGGRGRRTSIVPGSRSTRTDLGTYLFDEACTCSSPRQLPLSRRGRRRGKTTTDLIVVHADPLQLLIRVAAVLSVVVNSVLFGDGFPASSGGLVSETNREEDRKKGREEGTDQNFCPLLSSRGREGRGRREVVRIAVPSCASSSLSAFETPTSVSTSSSRYRFCCCCSVGRGRTSGSRTADTTANK